VFCGSSAGSQPAYLDSARRVGATLARAGIALVYGGASVGTMGAVADAALEAGGHVIGIIPRALAHKEIAHYGLPDLRVVGSMHERKALMAELSDAFIALPGGMGTLEELCEMLTWGQLGLHAKPCGLLNVLDYYSPLAAFFDHAVEHGFLRAEHRDMILVDDGVDSLLARMRNYVPPVVPKWIVAAEA